MAHVSQSQSDLYESSDRRFQHYVVLPRGIFYEKAASQIKKPLSTRRRDRERDMLGLLTNFRAML